MPDIKLVIKREAVSLTCKIRNMVVVENYIVIMYTPVPPYLCQNQFQD